MRWKVVRYSQRYRRLPLSLIESSSARKRFKQQKGLCFFCGEPLDDTTDKDHLVPRSMGGENAWTNRVLCHRRCNQAKADRLPTDEELVKFNRIRRRRV